MQESAVHEMPNADNFFSNRLLNSLVGIAMTSALPYAIGTSFAATGFTPIVASTFAMSMLGMVGLRLVTNCASALFYYCNSPAAASSSSLEMANKHENSRVKNPDLHQSLLESKYGV
jgi:uncharacterized membrane protein YccC